jgi:hypothetical protein
MRGMATWDVPPDGKGDKILPEFLAQLRAIGKALGMVK